MQFVLMFKNPTLRTVIDPLLEEAGFAPRILSETFSNLTPCSMVKNNMTCSLVIQNYVEEQQDAIYLYLPSHSFWELCATYKKDHYLTKASKAFTELMIEYYHSTAEENNRNVA